jgi:hypothetical protein
MRAMARGRGATPVTSRSPANRSNTTLMRCPRAHRCTFISDATCSGRSSASKGSGPPRPERARATHPIVDSPILQRLADDFSSILTVRTAIQLPLLARCSATRQRPEHVIASERAGVKFVPQCSQRFAWCGLARDLRAGAQRGQCRTLPIEALKTLKHPAQTAMPSPISRTRFGPRHSRHILAPRVAASRGTLAQILQPDRRCSPESGVIPPAPAAPAGRPPVSAWRAAH